MTSYPASLSVSMSSDRFRRLLDIPMSFRRWHKSCLDIGWSTSVSHCSKSNSRSSFIFCGLSGVILHLPEKSYKYTSTSIANFSANWKGWTSFYNYMIVNYSRFSGSNPTRITLLGVLCLCKERVKDTRHFAIKKEKSGECPNKMMSARSAIRLRRKP